MFRKRNKAVFPVGSRAMTNSIRYSETEALQLRKEINLLRNPPENGAAGWHGSKLGSPAMRNLLAIPSNEVYDRVFQLATVYQLPQALILSGCMESALHPIDASEFPGKEGLAHAFNCLVFAMGAISLANTCTITWGIASITAYVFSFRFARPLLSKLYDPL